MTPAGNNYSKLDATIRQQLANSLRPIDRTAEEVRRGNVRDPFISVENPAQGRFSALAIRLIGKCARSWGMDSRFPEALRALKGSVPGYFVFHPVEKYDKTDSSQLPVYWYEGNRRAVVNLLELFQPRNLDVPRGYVSEMPVSLEEIGGRLYVVIHAADATIRDKKEIPEEEEQTLLTATDDDLTDDPEDLAAPGTQSR